MSPDTRRSIFFSTFLARVQFRTQTHSIPSSISVYFLLFYHVFKDFWEMSKQNFIDLYQIFQYLLILLEVHYIINQLITLLTGLFFCRNIPF